MENCICTLPNSNIQGRSSLLKSTDCTPEPSHWRAAATLSFSSSVFPTLPPPLLCWSPNIPWHPLQISVFCPPCCCYDNSKERREDQKKKKEIKEKGSEAPLSALTWVNKLLQFLLALVDHCSWEASVGLPGLPVGSYHHQLLPHHCGHPGPLWCHPVHITLRYTGKAILSKVKSDSSMFIRQWNCNILYVHNICHV